jgi:predicted DNA-binding transcriptional regulator YafY
MLRALERATRGLSIGELREAIGERSSERTAYRDVEQLEHAGFPIMKEGARWRLLGGSEGGWTVPLDPTQILALALTEELFAPLEGSYLAEPLAELRTRLQATLTPAARRYVGELRRAAVATLFVPGHYAGRRAELDAIQEAIEKQHLLRITHAKPGTEPIERVVAPYATWYAGGKLYLVGHCHRAEAVRSFAVARIVAAEVLDEDFDPDPAFDLGAFVRRAVGVYKGEIHDVVIELGPAVAHLAAERRLHPSQRVERLASGAARLIMRCAGLPEIASWVAGFGGKARPLAPAELVAMLEQLHREGLEALTLPTDAVAPKGPLARGKPAETPLRRRRKQA